MRKEHIYFIALAGLFFIPLISLRARDIVITIEDADLGIPLEGAILQSWDGSQYECDENGQTSLQIPGNRPVVIRAAYPGYENGRLLISPGGDTDFTLALRLGGIMESRELVVEEQRPGSSETRSGRSVAIADRDLSRTAEIGIVEDVMASIKLLPGVGYSGSFNAQPSIRGGYPGDLTAVLDGFYIEMPYHWVGAVSIFDPGMVEAAKLSHGVFSTRYGHTISGLLEVSSKQPSPETAAVTVGVSTSAASMNLQAPLGKDGSFMLMGKVTYWDPFIWAAKKSFDEVRSIKTAPYIRSGAASANYRLTPDLKWTLNGFFGIDGVGVRYTDEERESNLRNDIDLFLDYRNSIGFLTTGFLWNPAADTMVKASAGTGFSRMSMNMRMAQRGSVRYSQDFIDTWGSYLGGANSYSIDQEDYNEEDITITTHQGRIDVERGLGGGFLAAFGVQELYSLFGLREDIRMLFEEEAGTMTGDDLLSHGYYTGYPLTYKVDVRNRAFQSSAYALLEYETDNRRFGAELGLRVDHLYFLAPGFAIQNRPVPNPRLNLDFGILRNTGGIDSLSLTLGTGLFSSLNDTTLFIDERSGIDDYEMKLNRSWTSLAGTKLEFAGNLSLSLEGYYKYIFDRAYQSVHTNPGQTDIDFRFDGQGRVWGFDLMLQKTSSRWWDGWISYSFVHARYRDPHGVASDLNVSDNEAVGDGWYYPSFHRFHTLNTVLNIKPSPSFNIMTRLGFASGIPQKQVGAISSYPVRLTDGSLIEKYKRPEAYSNSKRGGFLLPLDVKFSFYTFDKKGKVKSEIYFAVENLLALVYTPKGEVDFNGYTGKEESDSSSDDYRLPIPLPSFGFKWSY
ncbi:MAG: hypothetical protein LBK13_07215 [Spirochaetales bacterium]|nr:hypothetical protein [Spirochaetales bacterium]